MSVPTTIHHSWLRSNAIDQEVFDFIRGDFIVILDTFQLTTPSEKLTFSLDVCTHDEVLFGSDYLSQEDKFRFLLVHDEYEQSQGHNHWYNESCNASLGMYNVLVLIFLLLCQHHIDADSFQYEFPATLDTFYAKRLIEKSLGYTYS